MATHCSHGDCTCDYYREVLEARADMSPGGICINCHHAVNLHPRRPTAPTQAQDLVIEALKNQTESINNTINNFFRLVVGMNAPVPESTASQRNENQSLFKNSLKLRYPHCVDASNSNILKCMLLDHFFSADQVTAGHIIGLTNPQAYALAGMNYSMDRYHERNGFLLFCDIDVKYGNQLITFIYNETDHLIRLQVLYDDILPMQVGKLTKKIIGGTPANSPLTYGDINGRPLILPNFTLQPYRRAIVFVSKTACDNALGSLRSHNCLLALGLTDERWEAIMANVRGDSVGFGDSPFGRLANILNDV